MSDQNETRTAHFVTLKLSITRKWGAIDATFGIEEGVEIGTLGDMIREYDRMTEALNHEITHFAAEYLPKYGSGSGAGAGSTATSGMEDQEIIKIVKNINMGKPEYKVFTPRFNKYGINLWDNQPQELDVESILNGAYSVDKPGFKVKVQLNGNKGRVVSWVGR